MKYLTRDQVVKLQQSLIETSGGSSESIAIKRDLFRGRVLEVALGRKLLWRYRLA